MVSTWTPDAEAQDMYMNGEDVLYYIHRKREEHSKIFNTLLAELRTSIEAFPVAVTFNLWRQENGWPGRIEMKRGFKTLVSIIPDVCTAEQQGFGWFYAEVYPLDPGLYPEFSGKMLPRFREKDKLVAYLVALCK